MGSFAYDSTLVRYSFGASRCTDLQRHVRPEVRWYQAQMRPLSCMAVPPQNLHAMLLEVHASYETWIAGMLHAAVCGSYQYPNRRAWDAVGTVRCLELDLS